MADEAKIGTVWSDEDLDAIVADYFAMLSRELTGQAYVKRRHSATLMTQIGRTHRSVEFKHQNISAVLEEMGLPWIQGYKPKKNYQTAIFAAIDRYLSVRGDAQYVQPPPKVLIAAEEGAIFVDAFPVSREIERPESLQRLVRKFDPVERDFRNRTLGRAGEEFVLNIEKRVLIKADRADLARKVRWVSVEDGDGAGFDILSYDPAGRERLIEVKTTNGAAKTPFFITRTENEVAHERPADWQLYRVHLFSQSPRIARISPPLAASLRLRPEIWRAEM